MPAASMSLSAALDMAIGHFQAGQFESAEAIFQQVLQADPGNPNALNLLGILCIRKGDPERAVELIGQVVRRYPQIPDFHANLGAAWHASGRFDEAIAAYRQALSLQPDSPETAYNLGNALKDIGRFGEAETQYRRAIALHENYPDAHNNLGLVAQTLGRPGEALGHYRRALALRPDYAEAANNLGNALRDLGRLDEALAAYRQALQWRADFSAAHGNLLFTLTASDLAEPAEVYREHCAWGERYAGQGALHHVNQPDPQRRLRIGFVSADFREHPVARFCVPLLAALGNEGFEVYAYYNRPFGDALTERIKTHCDHWREIWNLDDERAAALIRDDTIDILVDLGGHTAGNRLPLFARKPAPLQMSWLGYPNTDGLATIDYRVSDALADPPGMSEAWHTETLLRLPHGFLCFTPPDDAPPVAEPPCLRNGYPTFGSFNNFAKATPRVLALWASLLGTLPGSRLVLKYAGLDDGETARRLRALFAEQGVDGERIELLGRTATYREHLAAYAKIDIALDPFPYNGTTTTCEALWMGVPVVTLAGRTHAGRVGVSLLHHAGLAAWIARDQQDYLRIAGELAAAPDSLKQWRATLRARLQAAPLCDCHGFAKAFASACREVWRDWCAQAATNS